jgi:hypothetical protein
MPTAQTARASQVMRITVAAVLLFSCAHVVRALASSSASTSPKMAARCARLTRNVVLEVGAVCVEPIRPPVSQFPEVVPTPSPVFRDFEPGLTHLLVRIWPEHRRLMLRRLPLATSDPGH